MRFAVALRHKRYRSLDILWSGRRVKYMTHVAVMAEKKTGMMLYVLGIVMLLSLPIRAASLYTEPFTTSNGGWTNRSPLPTAMLVASVTNVGNPAGSLRGVFAEEQTPSPVNDGAFVATGHLASASFIGNYSEVDAWVLGFDFMASNIVPSDLRVRIYSATNIITRTMTGAITTNGVWYSFRIPLLSPELGGWGGNLPQYFNIMTNVTRVEFYLVRNNTGTQFYFLDNVFLDRLPDAVDITANDLFWLHMRIGANYRLEATTNLNDGASWVPIESFTATSTVYSVTISTTNAWRTYRMLMQ